LEDSLANTKSALKEIRKTARRRVRSRVIRTSTRTHVKRAVQASDSGAQDNQALLKKALSALDKAAAKGVIHRNAAARRKSRLVKKLRARAAQT
jgi:small subunit ribosomal protein S20